MHTTLRFYTYSGDIVEYDIYPDFVKLYKNSNFNNLDKEDPSDYIKSYYELNRNNKYYLLNGNICTMVNVRDKVLDLNYAVFTGNLQLVKYFFKNNELSLFDLMFRIWYRTIPI